jgi:hypothetical protein
VRRRTIRVLVAALALALAPGAAAAFDAPSRVAAVRAVIQTVETHFPIMKNPAYTQGTSGIETTCRRRAAGRYGCTWRAVNRYSIIDGRAAVRFRGRDAHVRLFGIVCLRSHESNRPDAVISPCANG